MENKIIHGQFYTKGNPFLHKPFIEWFNSIEGRENMSVVEPFAGANNIISLTDAAGLNIKHSQWSSFDIDPEAITTNLVPDVKVEKKDTIKYFPKGYQICLSNPPYLAKNSATRKGTSIDFGEYGDLFEVSLKVMLDNCEYVAVIIPESFIVRGNFTERLQFVISLNYTMFDDTDFPVCLAVFGKTPTDDYVIYVGDRKVGWSKKIYAKSSKCLDKNVKMNVKFNIPEGQLGLYAVDGTLKPNIRFVKGDTITSSKVKHTSRAITRISLPEQYSEFEVERIIVEANRLLSEYRVLSQDVFLTSFKGLRKDGFYRRRLDYKTAAQILNKALHNLNLAPII